MTAVKICGITRVEDVRLACELGASWIGLNFSARSPRKVGIESSRALADAVAPGVLRVGVFVDETLDEIGRAAEAARLDLVQMHRPVSTAEAAALPRPLLAVVHVGAEGPAPLPDAVSARCKGVLFDTAGRSPGGTGETFDWSAIAGRREGPLVFVAGGLTPENVGRAIAIARPDAVDVASGVEASPGRKDLGRMRRFFEAVAQADRDAARRAG
jgi:phosphoribosylanthranilate isomerase